MALPLARPRPDPVVLDLFAQAGENAREAALLLVQLLDRWPDAGHLGADLVAREHAGDRLTHDIIHRLGSAGQAGPLAPQAARTLATAIDDIVDHIEQAAGSLALYAVEAPMEQAAALADVLVGAVEQVQRALGCLATGAAMGPHLVEIHRLENEGDRVSRAAIADLFVTGIDPMVVIRWKDIFEGLEAAVDACETVAHLLEGITLARGARG